MDKVDIPEGPTINLDNVTLNDFVVQSDFVKKVKRWRSGVFTFEIQI